MTSRLLSQASRATLPLLRTAAPATLALGCALGETPHELRLELPALITSKQPVVVHARAVSEDGSSRELSGIDFRVAPADLASVGKGGVFTCQRSGAGSVSAKVGGAAAEAKFECKLAARLEAPARLVLDLKVGEVDPAVKVLDSAGRELDLPISLTSDRGSIVQARGGRLAPGNVGTARITARSGELSQPIEIEVVRTLEPELVPIDQNRRISYSLEPGKYRLSVRLPTPHAVAVDWLGAPYCAYRGSGTEHVAECTLQGKGGVSFDNPAFVLRGERIPSREGVELREVP